MNPYAPNTKEYSEWQFGYDNEPWSAPANNATAAAWLGYHQAAKDKAAKE